MALFTACRCIEVLGLDSVLAALGKSNVLERVFVYIVAYIAHLYGSADGQVEEKQILILTGLVEKADTARRTLGRQVYAVCFPLIGCHHVCFKVKSTCGTA